MAISMMRTLPDLSKMEPLDGTNFKHWSQKLLIFFEQLEVDYVLFTNPPEITPQTTDASTAIVTTSQTVTDSSRKEDELKAKYEKDNKTTDFNAKAKKFKKNVQQKSHKGNDGKIQKNKCQCYCCGKTGHKAYPCYQQKTNQKQNPQLNLAETKEIIAAVVVEANLVENKVDWILDTGASKHFCANKDLFQEFHEVSDGECVFMGNKATAGVMGK
ncbi:UNVERIFIED_CONTAM: hypothetical protein Scaly_1476000 [Sesamum calycinum]|uniref:CCHC-type domain-containing protein n=1 Tax=Sesamum calycinum TaxID=2727403 RepID=A0AAW2PSG1_9LAMI